MNQSEQQINGKSLTISDLLGRCATDPLATSSQAAIRDDVHYSVIFFE